MRRRPAPVLAALALVVGLAGCQLGERPTLGAAPAPIDDASIEAVLNELTAGAERAFTAEYTVTAATGDTTTATVEQSSATTRTVTVATTQYVTDRSLRQTCDVDTSECRPGHDAQPISLYAVTPDFFGPSAIARLRRDAAIRVGPTTETTETIAGQTATCVAVPVADTASMFCALAGGPLARWRTTDLTVELVAFSTP